MQYTEKGASGPSQELTQGHWRFSTGCWVKMQKTTEHVVPTSWPRLNSNWVVLSGEGLNPLWLATGISDATNAYNGSGRTMKPRSNRVCSLSVTQVFGTSNAI
jgi:hypothetical protein